MNAAGLRARFRGLPLGTWLYALHLWTVFGLALSNAFVALAALSLVRLRGWRRFPWGRWTPVLAPLALYLALLFASVVFSYRPSVSVEALGELSSLAALPFALFLVRGRRAVRFVADGLVAVAGVLALYGLLQLLLGFGGLHQRIRGPFSHYMTFAGVLVLADLVVAADLVCGTRRRSLWRWAAFVAINLALMFSLTRSAWVAVLGSFVLLLLLRAPRLLVALVPASVVVALLMPVSVLHRAVSIFDLHDISNYDRLCMVEAGMHMVAERPLLGQGPEMVERRYRIYRHPTAPRLSVPHLHNTPVHLAAERGLPALGAYLWLMGASLVAAWAGYRRTARDDPDTAALYAGAFLAVVAFNLAGIFEYNWGDSEVQRTALFLVAAPFCLAGGDEGSPADVADDPGADG